MFKPSIGRIVHFYDTSFATHEHNGTGKGPYAAIVTRVYGEPMTITDNPHVDLKVLTADGDFYATSVRQRGGEDDANHPDDSRYFEEPPRVEPSIDKSVMANPPEGTVWDPMTRSYMDKNQAAPLFGAGGGGKPDLKPGDHFYDANTGVSGVVGRGGGGSGGANAFAETASSAGPFTGDLPKTDDKTA
jgi:hypothetical protein